MSKFLEDFTSQEQRIFKWKLGRSIASSLSGFIAGVVVASIIWFVGFLIFTALT